MSDRDEDHGETHFDLMERFARQNRSWKKKDVSEYFANTRVIYHRNFLQWNPKLKRFDLIERGPSPAPKQAF